jgi:hypothetical protein
MKKAHDLPCAFYIAIVKSDLCTNLIHSHIILNLIRIYSLTGSAGTFLVLAISAFGNLDIGLSNKGFAIIGFFTVAITAFPILDNQVRLGKTILPPSSLVLVAGCWYEALF